MREGVDAVRVGRPESARPELLEHCADAKAAKMLGVSDLASVCVFNIQFYQFLPLLEFFYKNVQAFSFSKFSLPIQKSIGFRKNTNSFDRNVRVFSFSKFSAPMQNSIGLT